MRDSQGKFAALHTADNVANTLVDVVRVNDENIDWASWFIDNRGRELYGHLHSVAQGRWNEVIVRVLLDTGRVHDIHWRINGLAIHVLSRLSCLGDWRASYVGPMERLDRVFAPGF